MEKLESNRSMVEQKEEQVLAIIDRGTMRNPDTGYALAIASLQGDGIYRAATSAEFPNKANPHKGGR